VYAVIYTRRGTPQHERFIDAYIDHGKYVTLSDALYVIDDVSWLREQDAFRWAVHRVEFAASA
jgi:hypothetical protein